MALSRVVSICLTRLGVCQYNAFILLAIYDTDTTGILF